MSYLQGNDEANRYEVVVEYNEGKDGKEELEKFTTNSWGRRQKESIIWGSLKGRLNESGWNSTMWTHKAHDIIITMS